MRPLVLPILINTLLVTLLQLPPPAFAQQSVSDPVYGLCNTAVFTANDSFAHNLDAVATSLSKNASRFLYSLASSSESGDQSNFVYGMYQCRGDVSLSDCSSCVIGALSGLRNSSSPLCGWLARGARFQFRGCYVRYESSSDFFTTLDTGSVQPPTCTGSAHASSKLYRQNLVTALEDSATAAPQHPLFGYNATSVGSGSNTAYALTQCLGFLNSSQCAACLSQVSNFSTACPRSASGEVYFVDCYYLFSNTSLLFTLPPSPNSPVNAPPPPINSPAPSPAPTHNVIPPSVNSPVNAPPPTINSPSPAISGTRARKNHKAAIVGIVVGVLGLLAMMICHRPLL